MGNWRGTRQVHVSAQIKIHIKIGKANAHIQFQKLKRGTSSVPLLTNTIGVCSKKKSLFVQIYVIDNHAVQKKEGESNLLRV